MGCSQRAEDGGWHLSEMSPWPKPQRQAAAFIAHQVLTNDILPIGCATEHVRIKRVREGLFVGAVGNTNRFYVHLNMI